MSAISQFGVVVSPPTCRRPTLPELRSIVGVSTIGAKMYTDSDNQISSGEIITAANVGINTSIVYSFIAGSATQTCLNLACLIFNESRLICKSSGVGWIVAPATAQVSRTWYCRNDALLTAQSVTKTCCTQWFVPTVTQLQNPGYCCRTFWDSFSSACYWSSTDLNATYACFVYFTNGGASVRNKSIANCVRAFRCVTY
jgi:hypothetical protein